jgi:hypothetical protein
MICRIWWECWNLRRSLVCGPLILAASAALLRKVIHRCGALTADLNTSKPGGHDWGVKTVNQLMVDDGRSAGSFDLSHVSLVS